MRRHGSIQGLGLAGLLAVGVFAPAAGEAPPAEPAATERLELPFTQTERVRLVLVPAIVTDRRGRLVRGMGRESFRVYEDYVPQEIRFFSEGADGPVAIAFMLDVSGSMRQLNKLARAKAAIREIVDRLQPEDRYALVCFADDQVAWVTGFTRDRARFLKRLEVQRGYGATALRDAVATAPGLVQAETEGRKAIVLLTDGVDNASRMSMWTAIKQAREATVPIYAIGLLSVPLAAVPEGRTPAHLKTLDRVAAETGGRLLAVDDAGSLERSVERLVTEVRSRYVIGYYSTRRRADGQFRRIRLEVDRGGVEVRTRSGYYALP